MGEVEGFGEQGIGGDRAVGRAQLGEAEGGRQAAGVLYLHPIGEHHHLHGAIAGVVAVGDGVDDRFADHFRRNLIGSGGLGLATAVPWKWAAFTSLLIRKRWGWRPKSSTAAFTGLP